MSRTYAGLPHEGFLEQLRQPQTLPDLRGSPVAFQFRLAWAGRTPTHRRQRLPMACKGRIALVRRHRVEEAGANPKRRPAVGEVVDAVQAYRLWFRGRLRFKETFGLEGQRWQHEKGLRWLSLCALLLPKWRSAASVLGLLLLLLPYGSGFLLLAASQGPSCGMQCCKRSKVCCCGKSDKHARHDGPSWVGSSKCPGGCGQLPAVPGTAAASLAAARIEVSPVLPLSHVRISPSSPRDSSGAAFALFERPPPSV
jgi:hypothetical protein